MKGRAACTGKLRGVSVARPSDVPVRSPECCRRCVFTNVTLLALAALIGVTPLVWVIIYPPGR